MMLAACAALLLLAAGGEAAVTKGGTSHAFGALCSLFFEAGDAAATIAHIGHEVDNVTAEALTVARNSTGRGRAWRGEEGKVLGTLLEGAKDEGFNKAVKQCEALKQQGPMCKLLLLAKNVTDSATRARSVAHTARFGQSCTIAGTVPEGPPGSTEAGECISRLLHKSEGVQKGFDEHGSGQALGADMAWLCNDPASTAATTGCGGTQQGTQTCPCDPGDTKDIAKAGVTWSKMLSRSGTAGVSQHDATSGQLNKNWQITLDICERREGRKHTVAHLTSSRNTRAKTEALKQLLRNGLSSKKKCLASARASTCAAIAEDDSSACVCYEGSDDTRRPPWEQSMDELADALRLAEEARRQALKLEQRIERQAENIKNQGTTDEQAPRGQGQNVNSTSSQDAGLPHNQTGTDSTQKQQGTTASASEKQSAGRTGSTKGTQERAQAQTAAAQHGTIAFARALMLATLAATQHGGS
ncbi:hypothetical protein, conserved in T. vivax [Trypanosoma vivax Y486]|uniref:Variant surface glycoprotein (VSG) n=1 Tax=Trypanosoma vivax (strain Y486) TaxID=1055687 RepID=F9WQE5_TRYVY|nr:hypothetical protein, conserved in T. vivax [Trypanosoma vivax Y486]|eukprot:CCD19773.1 hypothetical protein, conserved in T. vivax [Trypanosoma vivax Y486]